MMWHEMRVALRRLGQHPLHLAAGVLAIGLGIGVNVAMFSLGQSMLFKPLELRQLGELEIFQTLRRDGGVGLYEVSPADWRDYRDQLKSFAGLAYGDGWNAAFSRDGEAEQVAGARVSVNWAEVLGMQILLGRSFRPGEDEAGKHRVMLLSEGVWTRRYGRDPRIVGRKVVVNREEYEITGVVRDTSRYPAYAHVYVPFVRRPDWENKRAAFELMVVGRRRAGVSEEMAQAELNVVQQRIGEQYRDTHQGRRVELVGLAERVAGGNGLVRSYVEMLLWATGFALLIACANVTNLQLARVTGRAREFALLSALGAGRWAIARLVLVESLLLGLGGAVVGLLAAVWSLDAVKRLLPAEVWQFVPMWPYMQVDWQAVGGAMGLAIVAGLISGLAPVLNSLRGDVQEGLREGGRSASAGRKRQWFRAALVSSQMALALVLLIGAGLMVRSVQSSLDRHAERRPEQVATMETELPATQYGDVSKRVAFVRRLEEELHRLPGAGAVALVNGIPLADRNWSVGYVIEGRAEPKVAERPWAYDVMATPGYLELQRLRLVEGRWLAGEDGEGTDPVCVVNEALVEQSFRGDSALGRRLVRVRGEERTACRIVGVVASELIDAWDRAPRATVYRPLLQTGSASVAMMVRTEGDVAGMLGAMRRAVLAVDGDQPVQRAFAYQELIAITFAGLRMVALFMATIGVVALVLACLGVFSVMSYVVSERTNEIGMRVAMGAGPRDIAQLLGKEGMRMCGSGMVVGLAGGYGLAQMASSLIFGIRANDFWSLAGVSLLLGSVAVVAMYLPARKAIHMDPSEALRHD